MTEDITLTITGEANQENENGEFVEIEDTLDDDERRRFIALDQAIRVHGGSPDNSEILKAARAFEAYLKGEPHCAEPTLVA